MFRSIQSNWFFNDPRALYLWFFTLFLLCLIARKVLSENIWDRLIQGQGQLETMGESGTKLLAVSEARMTHLASEHIFLFSGIGVAPRACCKESALPLSSASSSWTQFSLFRNPWPPSCPRQLVRMEGSLHLILQ